MAVKPQQENEGSVLMLLVLAIGLACGISSIGQLIKDGGGWIVIVFAGVSGLLIWWYNRKH